MRTQYFARAAMGVTAEFIAVECFGCYDNFIRKPRLAHEMFHDELCHGRAADVAVADEEYFLHGMSSCIFVVVFQKSTAKNSGLQLSRCSSLVFSH